MEIAAGQFKARCLQLMDHVRDTHEKVVITKHGQPVAQLVPVAPLKPVSVFGRMKGELIVVGDLRE